MKHTNTKRLLSWVLSVCMILTMFSGLSMTASAAGEVKYVEVTSATDLTDGQYLIVFEEESFIMDGSLSTLDAINNYKTVTIKNNTIEGDNSGCEFTINAIEGGYSIKSASGFYIGNTGNSNGLKSSETTAYVNEITVNDAEATVTSASSHLRFNTTSGQDRFRYFKSGSYKNQKPIQLYKRVEEAAGFKVTVTCDAAQGSVAVSKDSGLQTGDPVTLTATANAGYEFVGWTVTSATNDAAIDDEMANPATLTIGTSDVTVEATFSAQTHTITSVKSGSGTGELVVEPSAATGAAVDVIALADAGSILSSLTVANEGNAYSEELTVDAEGNATFTMPAFDVTVTAVFNTEAALHNITVVETTDGTVEIDPANAKAAAGEIVTLTATPNDGFNFDSWYIEGATTGNVIEPEVVDNSAMFEMPDEDVNVTAFFKEQQRYTVYFVDNTNPELIVGETKVLPDAAIVLPDALVNYAPADAYGYTFVGWSYTEEIPAPYAEIDWSKYTADENNEVYVYAVYAKQTGSSEITISAKAKDGTRYYAAANTDDSKLTAVTDVSEALRFNKISKGKSEDGKDLYNFTYVDANGQTWYVEHGSSSKLSVTTTPAHESGAWKLDGAKLISVTDSGRALGLNTQTSPPTFRAYDPNGGTYPTDLIMEGGVSYSGYTTNPQPAVEEDLGSLSVIFNYDNDQELLISDLTGKSDSTVTKVEIAEDSTGAVTAVADTERVDLGLNQSLSAEVTLAFRVEYADGAIYTGNLVVTTGDKIYYDDANRIFEFSKNDTTTQGEWIPTDKAAITLTAKLDDATDYVEGFNSLTHHAGTVHQATVLALDATTDPATATWPSVTFDFCGTGFDLITEMNSNTGAVLVTVYDGEVNVVKNVLFDLYYGAKLENGEWIAQDNGSVYQIPSTISGLPWGQYTVEVSVRYSPVFDHLSKDDTYDFFFDGVRIHDPLNRAETNSFIYSSENILDSLKSEAGNTPVFIDGMDAATAADIETYGLKGEVLLANGQSVALRVSADLEADIEIGAHAVNDTAAEMAVFEVDDFSGTTTTPACTHTIASSTEMHYAVTGLTWEPSGSASQTKVLVIRNTGAGILALTDVRTTGSGFGLTFNSATDVPAAIRFTRQLNENINTFASLTDVVEGAWYYDSVKTVVEAGIMRGKGNGRFAPNDKLTRAEVVKVLHTLAGSPEVETTHSFTDVKAGSWYADAVAWGAANGIVKGVSETTFAPNATVTREQMVVFLHRFAGSDTVDSDEISAFVDGASVSNFAVEAMNWAVANGIVSGMGHNDLAPKGTSTRAQMAKILASCESVIGK